MTFSKKNHSTPLHSTPLHSTPLHSTPLHSTHSTELFKIFFSLLTLSTAFLQKASGPGKNWLVRLVVVFQSYVFKICNRICFNFTKSDYFRFFRKIAKIEISSITKFYNLKNHIKITFKRKISNFIFKIK